MKRSTKVLTALALTAGLTVGAAAAPAFAASIPLSGVSCGSKWATTYSYSTKITQHIHVTTATTSSTSWDNHANTIHRIKSGPYHSVNSASLTTDGVFSGGGADNYISCLD